MKTKSELLKKANESFLEHWEFLREANPGMKLPVCKTFPRVPKITVSDITHNYGTESPRTLEVKVENGEVLQLKGASFENHHNSSCEITAPTKELKQFTEIFADNFLFNLLYEEGVKITEWQSLQD